MILCGLNYCIFDPLIDNIIDDDFTVNEDFKDENVQCSGTVDIRGNFERHLALCQQRFKQIV